MKRSLQFAGPTKGEGRIVRQQGGMHRYGHVLLLVESNDEQAFHFMWEAAPETIPNEFKHAVKLGIIGLFSNGAKFQDWDLQGITVKVVGGSSHETDSNEVSFILSSAEAFCNAVESAQATSQQPTPKHQQE